MSSPASTKNSDQLMQEIVVRVITIAEMLAKPGEAVSVGQESIHAKWQITTRNATKIVQFSRRCIVALIVH